MKPVPPTLKGKKRYIAFEVLSSGRVSKKQVIEVIMGEALKFFGELKGSEFSPWVVEFDEEKSRGFLVCDHRFKGEMITALTLITSVEAESASIVVLGVSGTVKSLKRKFLKDDTKVSQYKGEN